MKIKLTTFDYGDALKLMKSGQKVSCTRWGTEGKVYVEEVTATPRDGVVFLANYNFKLLMLTDTKRNTMIPFTPSAENQLTDEWYIVE